MPSVLMDPTISLSASVRVDTYPYRLKDFKLRAYSKSGYRIHEVELYTGKKSVIKYRACSDDFNIPINDDDTIFKSFAIFQVVNIGINIHAIDKGQLGKYEAAANIAGIYYNSLKLCHKKLALDYTYDMYKEIITELEGLKKPTIQLSDFGISGLNFDGYKISLAETNALNVGKWGLSDYYSVSLNLIAEKELII